MLNDEIQALTNRIELLNRKIIREKAAKKAAEVLLEEKSRELYSAKQLVEDSLIHIKEQSKQGMALLHFKSHLESILLDYNQLLLQKPISNILLQRLLDDLIGIENIKASRIRFKSPIKENVFDTFLAGNKALIQPISTANQPLCWSDDHQQIKLIIKTQASILGSLTLVIESPTSWQNTVEKQLLLFCDMISAAQRRQELLENTIKEKLRAESSEQSTRDFVAMINHELRTPLNGLLGSADLMLDTSLSSYQQQLLNTMHQSGELLRVIINDLLDLSKMSAGMLQIVKINFSPEKLCKMIFDIFKQRTDEFGLLFNYHYQQSIPQTLIGDPDRIKQILVNLIGNSIKFTRQGEIKVDIYWAEQALCFTVQDSGCGIPEDKIPTLFDPFTQVNNSSNRAYEGTGLGLAICKQLVDEMKGDIRLTSTLGEGSCFDVSLPLDIAKTSVLNIKQSQAQYPIETLDVLVVEDSKVNQMLIEMILAKFKITPAMANNGQEAIDFLANNSVDIIFMDCRMPVVDGFEATTLLRDKGYTKPIIALTASTTSVETEQCYHCGMDEIINKPYQQEDIKSALIKWGHIIDAAKQ
ncbi:hybrid sensor histidine kinase/response regulator [Shewanella sp. Choline-02u-19]|uniref:ATP-binding protein n=1 Tax=unclassified Shewanella TaxID=196818 RepID=UPI000C342AB3|nr:MULTISPECIES: ATP-binding protein [unclassified Shewanella]PKH55873.1 hybrid sensor histidine kinase/response regulator [Shewanella sp. Bg11-22]PKI27236.1 hybrid sensor histidine kinase/response regulator [Shewanella sp. Choline-02u-19]